MALLQLRLETLKDLDFGRPAVAFEQAMAVAVSDCCDRPGDKRPRKVALEFIITPIIEQEGHCDQVEGEFKIKTVLPHRQTKPYSFGLNKQGRLFFSEHSPQNVSQTTFDDLDEAGEVDRGSAEE